MHFNGVVVSDAMTMAGFRGWYKNDLEGQIASFGWGRYIAMAFLRIHGFGGSTDSTW